MSIQPRFIVLLVVGLCVVTAAATMTFLDFDVAKTESSDAHEALRNGDEAGASDITAVENSVPGTTRTIPA